MATTPAAPADVLDPDELKARIAELEETGKFAEAASLKTALMRPRPAAPDPQRDAQREELKARIAELDAAGRFAASAPLKTQLMRLQ